MFSLRGDFMTRTEFLNGVNDFEDLKDFCLDEDCDICDDVYDEYDRDGYIDERLSEIAEENSWDELRDILAAIPTGYDYYRCDGRVDWVGLDNTDFEAYKDDVLAWMDNGDYWEEEEPAEEQPVLEPFAQENQSDYGNEYEENTDEEELKPIKEEFTISELFVSCNESFKSL